jgi:hypothetical protein
MSTLESLQKVEKFKRELFKQGSLLLNEQNLKVPERFQACVEVLQQEKVKHLEITACKVSLKKLVLLLYSFGKSSAKSLKLSSMEMCESVFEAFHHSQTLKILTLENLRLDFEFALPASTSSLLLINALPNYIPSGVNSLKI